MNRRRFKLAMALAAVIFLGGAGFVAAGGEAMLIRQSGANAESGESQEGPILSRVHRFLRHIHDLHDHIFAPHGPDRTEPELRSYEENDAAK